MAEKKQEQVKSSPGKSTTDNESWKSSSSGFQGRPSTDKDQGEDLLDRFDQFGSLLGKGFDLVEAGVNLGLFLAERLSSTVQEQAINRFDMTGNPSYGGQSEAPYEEPAIRPNPGIQNERAAAGEAETPPQINYIVNRLPLAPGSPVQISFTINNDSPASPKRLRLRAEGFTGEMHGARIDSKEFGVKPKTKAIAPMDFDKFTLSGTIPLDVASDAYSGWIIVSEKEGELQIPVRLLVTN